MKRLFVLLAVLCASNLVYGQAVGTGAYAFSSFDNRGFDAVNLGNLNTRFTVPIVSRPGRGLSFQYSVQYEGLIWQAVNGAWTPDPAWGFSGMLNGTTFAGYLTHSTISVSCARPSGYSGAVPPATKYAAFIYHDPYGASHRFNYTWNSGCPLSNQDPTTTGDGSSSDGSGYSLVGQTQVKMRNGSVITPAYSATGQDNTNITDSNGNSITASGGNSFVDTLGVTALSISGSSPRVLSYPVALQSNSATSASATISYRQYTVQTNFQCSGITEYPGTASNLVDRITLADGSFYGFTYEATPGVSGSVTARLATITLPTSGTITYAYSGGCSSAGAGINADGTPGNLSRATTDGTRTYSRFALNANATGTTLQDEKGNQTVLDFTIDSVTGEFFETDRKVYQGSTTGTPLLTQLTCYNGAAANCDGQAIALPITEADVTQSYNNGSQVITKNAYDPVGALLTSSAQYNGSSLLKKTVTAYNALGEPIRVTSSDSSGATYADTQYGYDETALTATSGLPNHTSVSGTRGNLTSTQALVSGSTHLKTTTAYYDTGMPVSMADPGGFSTSYGYDSKQALVTQTNLPTPSSGVALATSATYDAASATPLSATGMNPSQTTTINQYNSMLSPTLITLPNGGTVSYTYSPNQVGVTQTMGSGANKETQTLLDAYGRVSRIAVANGQSTNTWYQTDYCYDSSGLLSFQSFPYQGPGWAATKVCSNSGTGFTYDALGRTTGTTTPDGTATTQYSSRAVKNTSVNGISRISQYDALGRLSIVCEISGNNLGADSPVPCGADIGGTGYQTTYGYDLANHKATIYQGAQSRGFQTDALGRPSITTEPERGTTNYGYSYNSVGFVVTRTRPKANQQGTQTTTTTTQYDTLGRVASISYDDGITPNKNYFYDVSAAGQQWSSSVANTKGLLAQMAASAGASSLTRAQFSYDLMGNVTTMWQCTPSICGTSNQQVRPALQLSYDLTGNLTQEFDGVSGAISYGRSPAGEITSITNQNYVDANNPPNIVSSVTNGPFGVTNYSLGNGTSVVRSYDSSGRLNGGWQCTGNGAQGSSAYCSGNTQIYGFTAGHKDSQVVGACDTVVNQCEGLSYDEFNRLTSVGGVNSSYTYTYDRYGNRTQQTSSPSGPQAPYSFTPSTNRISTMTYDAAGNVTSDGFYTYTYDAEGNVLSSSSGAQYVYDAMNRRIRTQVGSSTPQEYIFDPFGHRVSSWLLNGNVGGAGNEARIFWGGSLVATRVQSGETQYNNQDWLGTERIRTNHAGQAAATFTSLPFGENMMSNVQISWSDQDNLHLAGLDHDADTNTDHALFRQYSSRQGRWMSPDPYDGSYALNDPQSLNRYSYVENNPLSFTDPSGLQRPSCKADDSCVSGSGSGGGVNLHGIGDGVFSFGSSWNIFDTFNKNYRNTANLDDLTKMTFGGDIYNYLLGLGSSRTAAAPSNFPKPMTPATVANYALHKLCTGSPGQKIFKTVLTSAGIGFASGAFKGFVGGEIFGGEVTLGASGIVGGLAGGVIQGSVGAINGLITGSAYAAECKAGGAYD